MTANDSSNKRPKSQADSRGAHAYQTIRPKGWDFNQAAPESPPEAPSSPNSAQAARPARPNSTILPPPVNSDVHAEAKPPAAPIPTPAAAIVNRRQADTDPNPTNKSSHDTQSPQIAENLSDTIAYHTTSAAATEESAPANTATPAPPDSTWIGASGGLQVRRCGIGGTITGVPQSVMHSRGSVNVESRVEYTIQGVVGRGGMGVVQKARQTTLNRIVAIKSLQTRLTNPDTAQRMFVAEALITAGLVHPNIVPLHDMGVDREGRLFYSMKLVSGKTWQEMIPAQSLESNLDVLLKVCDAVAYAHSRGVINHDLKPENVIVGDFGEVVVLD
jgi:tRNA A-37 threonylcarbamoyl transferase component Bud32